MVLRAGYRHSHLTDKEIKALEGPTQFTGQYGIPDLDDSVDRTMPVLDIWLSRLVLDQLSRRTSQHLKPQGCPKPREPICKDVSIFTESPTHKCVGFPSVCYK